MHFDIDKVLRFSHVDFSLNELISMYYDNDLDVWPIYKPDLRWNQKMKGQYIESALMGLPLKGFLFNEEPNGMLSIVDGSERVRSVIDYIEGKYKLKGLKTLPEFNDSSFSDLDYKYQMRLKRSVLSIDILDSNALPILKCEYLKRINIGNSNFISQQARNFAYPRVYQVLSELRESLLGELRFSVTKERYGIRKTKNVLREYQFVLILVSIQYISSHRDVLNEDISLGSLIDLVTEKLEVNLLVANPEFIKQNIQAVLRSLNTENISIVSRTHKVLGSKFQSNDISMNDFLSLFFLESQKINSRLDRVNFDFFKEDSSIRKLANQI
jgi:hypothetical protein